VGRGRGERGLLPALLIVSGVVLIVVCVLAGSGSTPAAQRNQRRASGPFESAPATALAQPAIETAPAAVTETSLADPTTLPPETIPPVTVPPTVVAKPAAPKATTTTAPKPPPATPPSTVPARSGPLPPPVCTGVVGDTSARRAIVCAAGTPSGRGYWLVGADGGVFSYGDAGYFGSLAERGITQDVVAMAVTPSAKGYWLVTTDGGVSAFGDAAFRGAASVRSDAPQVAGMAVTPSGRGYWLVTADGAVSGFGDARPFGGLQGKKLTAPVIGMAATPSGNGYWLAAADGGIFTFGDAQFHGAIDPKIEHAPVVSVAATRDGGGYWLASSDGGVFTFGDAPFHGSAASVRLTSKVVSIAPQPDGGGYWLAGSDGGVFTYGTAAFYGSAWTSNIGTTIVATSAHGSIPVGIFYYPWYDSFGRSGQWRHWDQGGVLPPDEVGSDFYPARGPYSSADPGLIEAQMIDISQTGVQSVISSWWGRGSFEDARLPDLARSTAGHHLQLAIQLEPYPGRTPASVAGDLAYLRTRFGVADVYVFDATEIAGADWQQITAGAKGMRLFATGDGPSMISGAFQNWAATAGFDGIYTYTALFPPDQFPKVCEQARMVHLLCAPSVAPGYKASHATGDGRVVERNLGATYDAFWLYAISAQPDTITITSYNEWHEGTQIEAAVPRCTLVSFCSADYENSYSTNGWAAETAYLGRTKYWVDKVSRAG
jgi:hypothetical protein